MTRAITIYFDAHQNNYAVHEGENYEDSLCWDEMLGLVARLTLTDRGPRLKTPDEALTWFVKYRSAPRKQIEAHNAGVRG